MKRFVVAGGLFTLLFLAGPDAQAQTGSARGRVIDDQGQPLPDVKVDLEFQGGVNRKLETKTGKKGDFIQVGLQPGLYRITASKEGYQPFYVEERVSLGEPTNIADIKLVSAKAAAAAAAAKGGGAHAELNAKFGAAADLLKAGKLDDAEKGFREILVTNPTVPEAHFNLGMIAMQRKDWPGAEAEYQKALDLRPSYGDAWSALARCYVEAGQRDKAMEVMKEASAKNEGDASVQFNLGLFLLNAQETDAAEAAFLKSQSLDATNGEIEYYLGTIAVQKGKTAECLAHLEKYLASSPRNAQNAATAQGLITALKPKK